MDIFGAKKTNRKKKNKRLSWNRKYQQSLQSFTLAVNPKEYLEVLKSQLLNKTHKAIKKGLTRLGFENFAERIKSFISSETFEKPLVTRKEVSRLSVSKGVMVKKTVIESKLSQLNDKRFYFLDGIVSLPFEHKNLKEIDDFKKQKGKKIDKYFWEEKDVLLNMEKKHLKYTKTLFAPPNLNALT